MGRSTKPLKPELEGTVDHVINYVTIKNATLILTSLQFALGHHLFSEHQLENRINFDLSYNVSLLDFFCPGILDVKEHKFIHLLNYLKPNGLNVDDPFAVPILHR